MKRIGLGVPFIVSLEDELKSHGISIDEPVLSEGELLNLLWESNSSK
ncbi:cobalt transporter ATP-binding subunit [Listeria fleischmannii subsp. fleischmannii]|uniref:Cobalt transporter ATP-binding subunit n=2 Tax=Listeria fleischmannii TaxID=1069827 RepID=A0A2X3GL84_9LIST|nr:cobalt transporter ATP-binding subunit [Listeria fleischmannii subsp. fleischmannii]